MDDNEKSKEEYVKEIIGMLSKISNTDILIKIKIFIKVWLD